MRLVLQFLPLSLTALLPVINPIGSALIFLGLVGSAPRDVFRSLARRIAFSTILFLLAIDLGGAAILKFFGISLPVVQFAGGLVLAAMGWNLLNQPGAEKSGESEPSKGDAEQLDGAISKESVSAPRGGLGPGGLGSLSDKIFYPFTFPVTAGPGTIVVTLTLSAHASRATLIDETYAQIGIIGGILLTSVAVYLSYAYAEQLTLRVPRQTVHGVLRVIAFILLCIGVQIAWEGLSSLLLTLRHT